MKPRIRARAPDRMDWLSFIAALALAMVLTVVGWFLAGQNIVGAYRRGRAAPPGDWTLFSFAIVLAAVCVADAGRTAGWW